MSWQSALSREGPASRALTLAVVSCYPDLATGCSGQTQAGAWRQATPRTQRRPGWCCGMSMQQVGALGQVSCGSRWWPLGQWPAAPLASPAHPCAGAVSLEVIYTHVQGPGASSDESLVSPEAESAPCGVWAPPLQPCSQWRVDRAVLGLVGPLLRGSDSSRFWGERR